MDELDLRVRRRVYSDFVSLGRAPAAAEVGAELGLAVGEVEDSLRRLHDEHALVVRAGTSELLMANPFAAGETPHRVECEGRSWFGNCCWDALGIPGALHADGRVESECACCGEPVALDVREGRVAEGAELLTHILVPARRWWDDIVFT